MSSEVNVVMQAFVYLFCGCSCWLIIKGHVKKAGKLSVVIRFRFPCSIHARNVSKLAVVYVPQFE